MTLDVLHYFLGAASGCLVGFTLGLFGGGGSILAVPLLVHLVGVVNVHVAIATSAVAVAANAFISLLFHARHGTVQWKYAALYSATGMVGAWVGAAIGKALDGADLLALFSGLMIVISLNVFYRRHTVSAATTGFVASNAPKVLAVGAGTGTVSGFFGIGGGFLIVPGLIFATGMATINAVATSLVAIVAFGATTALSYSLSGFVDWPLAAVFVGGGAAGAFCGCSAVHMLQHRRSLLNTSFAGLVMILAIAMLIWR
ncbi:putative membrane protein YfcA [Neorhizobium galegae]|uniref:sulfite exporter TauE/SafE family protein n=1 Tax=Neorhizobium galegae TaxID=399 RepID=UPI001AE9363C|nr:sulfite exporter TauE/SafE family protein [Neorhizobium galegae]MBP2562516.1 putative membrane protein YfcA [Neorhizobium galegae]